MSSINLINGGLDVQSIVDGLITAERQPITRLEKQNQTHQSKISAYQTFNSKLLAFKTSVDSILFHGEDVPLNVPSSFSDRLSKSLFALRKATSSDEDVITATAGKGEATGTFHVTVDGLAGYHTYGSANFISNTETETGTGTLVIQKGSEDEVTFTITAENNSLQGIRDEINDADAGFTATVVNDGSATPYRLVITSDDSGSANELTITDNLTGGSALTLAQIAAANDATLTVNGVEYTRSSNSISDVILGVTLNLKAESGSSQIVVERDVDSIVSGIQDFVAKYNDVVSYIASQSKYDPATKKAGILAGDYTLRDTRSKLSSILNQSIAAEGYSLSLLSQIGIKLGNTGTYTVDETKLREQLSADAENVAHLFLADATDSEENTISLVPMLHSRLKGITDTFEGPVVRATNALQQNIGRVKHQIEEMESRLETRRAILLAQFTKADQALRQLSVMQMSLTSQLNTLSSLK